MMTTRTLRRFQWAASALAVSLAMSLAFGAGLSACGGSSDPAAVDNTPVSIKLIAMNDFHGNIEPPAENNGGAVVLKDSASATGTTKVRTGGAAYLATLIAQLKAKNPNNIVVGAGDMVGAAPVTSTLTHDEATIDILSQIGLEVTSVGNHEFDHGKDELLRQQNGGCFFNGVVGKDTCISGGVFPGAKYKWLSANVVDTASGKPLFPATLTRTFGSVKVGFIGLTLKATPTVVTSTGVAGLSFLDEATTINAEAAKLKAAGVQAVVVLIHQGGQTTAATLNDQSCPGLNGEILPIVDAISKDVDVVVSGHTHQEYVCTRNGKLLTSTGFYGSAVTEIDLTVTPQGGVTSKLANTVPVVNGLALAAGPATPVLPAGVSALAKNATIDTAVQSYVTLSAGLKNQVVGSITTDIKRALLTGVSATRDEGAEGAMGDVMADVYLAGGPAADIAFINPGGVRADLIFNASAGGNVTYGDLLTVAPFANTLATADLTGADLVRLLEQQWEAANCAAKPNSNAASAPVGTGSANGCGRMLQPSSNFSYSWNAAQPAGAPDGTGARVVASSLKIGGTAVVATQVYRVTFNSFQAPGGGDNFTVITNKGKNITNSGVIDIDAFVAYMKAHPKLAPPTPRVTRVN